jgi:dimethylhistidine N-methyltransferase
LKIVRIPAGDRTITLCDLEPTPDRICDDVVRGLTARPRKLPPKYFYDQRGAELFERITALEAYYPTRTELGILRAHGDEIARELGTGVRLVEFGSGSGEKTRVLLQHLREPAGYVPVDISRAQLVDFAIDVAKRFPGLEVTPVCADYTQEFQLPPGPREVERCVAFFPGSTIGNFESDEARSFLCRVRRLVGADGGLLIGFDLLKDVEVMERAYNDPEGVTAEFNLNLLVRINRECGADFDVGSFRHEARFDPEERRIEMRLVSDGAQMVRIFSDGRDAVPVTIDFAAGEYIVTEYSQKYDLPAIHSLAESAGWEVHRLWTDPDRWFAVVLLR